MYVLVLVLVLDMNVLVLVLDMNVLVLVIANCPGWKPFDWRPEVIRRVLL